MSEVWDQARLERYITEGIEESVNLDYKAAGALAKSDGKKTEITKDISAMANSAGGIVIYGIAEYQDESRKHLPEKIDPISRVEYSKEWLEHIVGNIQPRIDGVTIYPVSINSAPNNVVYVVEIPQSYTAHQARDMRYYKRFNFESVMMSDYEIRDVMGRRQHARIDLEFKILIHTAIESSPTEMFSSYDPLGRSKKTEPKKYTVYKLEVSMVNTGRVYAQYIEVFIEMPCAFVYDYESMRREYLRMPPREFKLDQYCTYGRDNTVRDLIKGGIGSISVPPEYGPVRYVPILPGIKMDVDDFSLTKDFEAIDWGQWAIKWTTHVDNAPPHSGEIAIKDIEIVDLRMKVPEEFDNENEDDTE